MEHITSQQFEDFCNARNETDAFTQYRKDSFAKIAKLGMPSYKCGLTIMVEPKNFDVTSLIPGDKKVHITTTNAEAVEVLHDAEAVAALGDNLALFTSEEWNEQEDEHKVHYYNCACANDIVFIRIPKGTSAEKPIEVHYDAQGGPLVSTIFVLCEPQSHARLLFYRSGKGLDNAYMSDDIRVLAQEGSSVDVAVIQDVNNTCVNFQKRKALLRKDSTVNWTDACIGAHYTRSEVTSHLNEPGATTTNTVLFLGTGEQRYDVYTGAMHNAQSTNSDLVTKGVINDHAQSFARGLISIRSNAPDSNGYEQQDTLMLSDTAQANAKPDLEIHNHNVKCSHGSTIGKVDQDLKFYLMSRGLSEKEAEVKIAEGYFAPVLSQFDDEQLQQRIHESIVAALLQ